MSEFDVEVVYMPGPTNFGGRRTVGAYPATAAREDVVFCGGETAQKE